ncbi:MAG: DNA recombination protein RmuC [Candidatus Roizmanbacteria bacterium]
MNQSFLLIGIIIGVVVLGILYLKKFLGSHIKSELSDIFPEVLKNAQEQLTAANQQQLQAEKQNIKTELESKKEAIEKLVEKVEKELKENDRTSQSILQQMKDQQQITKDLSVTTDSLRKVLTNNQMRGQFGEQIAEDLLKMAGFVKGIDFEYNKSQTSSTSRPDFALFLPDKTRINIDVKFPYANLQKATETPDGATKNEYLKAFEKDVRDKIQQVSSRDYINPKDKTVDFVILFIPNEMIFSYIYEKMSDIWTNGMSKKVVLAGPFSFTALLRMVRQAYDNFRYQKNIHEIVANIKEFEKQFELYTEEFDKLGRHLDTAVETYRRVETTRTKQLTKVVDRIKLDDSTSEKPLSLLEPEV